MTVTAPFNRRAIQDALITWFAGSTGLGVERVEWADQGAPQLEHPYASLKLGALRDIGRDEENINGEPANPVAGAEVAIESRGMREVVCSCNVYTRTREPEATAHALLDRARAALGMSTYLDPLCAAGVSYLRKSDAQNLDGLNGDDFVQRAQMDVTFSIASNAEDRVGYIAQVVLSSDLLPVSPIVLPVIQE